MAPKRNAPEELSGANKKRARMREQREIPVQAHIPRTGGSAEQGNNNLPSTIEVEKFAQTRSFEITAMQKAMKSAKDAGTIRAFQSLPRHLRRRAASHNIKRLPIRLRAKALFETPKDAAKPKKKTRKMMAMKRRKLFKTTRTAILLKRQWKKIWLETHIWHAKRMHMTEIWGHRLAEKPTEKAFRSSYRASFHGALLHDASYYQYIQLVGLPVNFQLIFGEIIDSSLPSPLLPRFIDGSRECKTQIYEPNTFPNNLIGPVTIFFKPMQNDRSSLQALVRVHPSIAIKVYDAIKSATKLNGRREPLQVKQLNDVFLTFEITGKRATEVVKGVLTPSMFSKPPAIDAWKKLNSAAGPGSVPSGMIFGIQVIDPRLSFPPKLDKSNPGIKISDLLIPSCDIARLPDFWDQCTREPINPAYSKKDIDARRSRQLVPGSKLLPELNDNVIPILVAQNTITSTKESSVINEMSGWTITIPANWGMAFWSSLVFSETRIGGLRERSQQYFEAGTPRFPEDYPGTIAFREFEERRRAADESYFNRRPPAKRPSYKKLGTPDPFLSNFESILSRWRTPMHYSQFLRRVHNDQLLLSDSQPLPTPWIVPDPVMKIVLEHLTGTRFLPTDPSSKLAERLLNFYQGAHQIQNGIPWAGVIDSIGINALVRVKVTPCGKGSPEELGLIYYLDGLNGVKEVGDRYIEVLNSVQKLNLKVGGGKQKLTLASGEDSDDWVEFGHNPTTNNIMGRITTGNYSLARGKGYAVGAIPLNCYLAMMNRDLKLQKLVVGNNNSRNNSKIDYPMLAVVRNRDGEIFRPVFLSLMS